MGKAEKTLQEGEAVFRQYFRKTLVALEDIPEGTKIEVRMVGAMRPQAFLDGLPSEQYENVVGKKTAMALKKYQPIKQEHLS